ncbi:MAG: 3-dehydroquinate synthase [Rhodospirillaceae bacterium]
MASPKPKNIIPVELGERTYEIYVGDNLLSNAGSLIAPFVRSKRLIVITDENVADSHLSTLRNALKSGEYETDEIVLKAGEQTKSFRDFMRLTDRILALRPERSTCLLALGGGVIGDLTGFAASTLLRGLDYIQLPTTLMSQVDSSIGGKTGINTRHGKNLIGSFHQPRLVVADTRTLGTLPKREFLSGYSEIVKYGLIRNPKFFKWLERNGKDVVTEDIDLATEAITVSCRTKAEIIAEDELEQGDRALLNLGHTFGHALEIETGFSSDLLHGEAVSIGMVMALDLSVKMGLCPNADAARLRRHLSEVGLPVGIDLLKGIKWNSERLLQRMTQDKKTKNGIINFILLKGIGRAFVCQDVKLPDVKSIFDKALNN